MTITIIDPVRLRDAVRRLVASSGRPLSTTDRAEVVAVLTRALIGPVARDEYLEALAEAQQRAGVMPAAGSTADLPEADFLRDGPASLGERLVPVAVDPNAIRALTDRVTVALASGTLGDVWMAAIEDIASVPEDYLGPAAVERNRVKLRQLIADPTEEPPPAERSVRGGLGRRAELGVALAASLLIGVGIGWSLRSPHDQIDVSAGPLQWETSRGDRVPTLEVRNSGRRVVFVCVVGLAPDKAPRVFEKDENQYIDVGAGESRKLANFDALLAGATTYLLVVTDTPAGDVVSSLLPSDARAERAGEIRDQLSAALRRLGYRAPKIEVITSP